MADYPALYFYTDAFVADTQHLDNEEVGIYIRLICFAWRRPNCTLPDDDHRLANMVGMTVPAWKKKRGVIMDFWTKENGSWFQKKLRKVRFEAIKRSRKAKLAADIRWSKESGMPLKGNDTGDANASSQAHAPGMPSKPITITNKKEGRWTPVESTVEWAIGKGFSEGEVMSMARDCVAKMKLSKGAVDMEKAFFSWVEIVLRDRGREEKSHSDGVDALLRSLKDEEPGERG